MVASSASAWTFAGDKIGAWAANGEAAKASKQTMIVFRIVFMVPSPFVASARVNSFHAFQRRLLPRALEHLRFGQVQPHDHLEGPTRRGQPVGFLLFARRIVLDDE